MSRVFISQAQPSEFHYHFIVTTRREQSNESRGDILTLDDSLGRVHETTREIPTAVRGFPNVVPLVITCAERFRWRRRIFLVSLSPWRWERQLWDRMLKETMNKKRLPPQPNGWLLPLDLHAELSPQLRCFAEMRKQRALWQTHGNQYPTSVPVAVAMVNNAQAGSPDQSLEVETEAEIRKVSKGPISWFSVPSLTVRPSRPGDEKPTPAMDLVESLNWLLSQCGMRIPK